MAMAKKTPDTGKTARRPVPKTKVGGYTSLKKNPPITKGLPTPKPGKAK